MKILDWGCQGWFETKQLVNKLHRYEFDIWKLERMVTISVRMLNINFKSKQRWRLSAFHKYLITFLQVSGHLEQFDVQQKNQNKVLDIWV